MTIQIKEYNGVKVTSDDTNPRIYSTEYKCYECGLWVDQDDAVWIDPKTGIATTGDEGKPYHIDCAPEEENYDDSKDS